MAEDVLEVSSLRRDASPSSSARRRRVPHVATHPRQDFVDTNVTATLGLLEESIAAGVEAFIFTSTTSTFGRANTPPPGEPAAWVTESVAPIPENIYHPGRRFDEGPIRWTEPTRPAGRLGKDPTIERSAVAVCILALCRFSPL